MRKSIIFILTAFLALAAGIDARAQESEYTATPVTISKDKVKNNGKTYYSHVVLERQTLFSISKAYNVTIQEIYDANPTLNLETAGLKKYQILMIPDKSAEGSQNHQAAAPQARTADNAAENRSSSAVSEKQVGSDAQEYTMHTVRWFEDLEGIAKKYNVSPEAIMKANGMTSRELAKRQKIKIPVPGTEDENEEESDEPEENVADTIQEDVQDMVGNIFGSRKDVNASLILPFNAAKTPNDNNLDFYSGVLMAIRDLEAEGIHTDLNVLDCASGMNIAEGKLDDCDLVLGPISTSDITSLLSIVPSSTAVISPLEPKAAALAASYGNLIQAPSPADSQCEDLINWLKQDLRSGDKVILFTEKGATQTSNSAALVKFLSASGIQYSSVSYGVLEGRDITSLMEKYSSAEHTNRIVIASESEAFVNDVVRHANLLAHRKYDVALYCPSKARSFETIEVENFHNTNLHVCLGYYVDYDSPKVQRFLMSYRALYNMEPSPFAYQGYDTAYYFIRMCSTHGRNWMKRIDSNQGKGLQSNFNFVQTDGNGYVNNASRRIVYGPEFSVKLAN